VNEDQDHAEGDETHAPIPDHQPGQQPVAADEPEADSNDEAEAEAEEEAEEEVEEEEEAE
jgi:hypothetical protein